MPYQIFETETFSRLYRAMEKVEQEWVDKIKNQLIENSQVGKPLKFDWFREKKFGDKRLYYLVYKDISKILLVAFGSKKEQQKIINHIVENKQRYKKIIDSA
jgi:mRNA-degrading endonuclease RelE of RelBE toxin-antitoxin system|tara:strand:+ start:7249 stop:7554 length:306 start_codon:yes stop_codon:yes gene_type:complete